MARRASRERVRHHCVEIGLGWSRRHAPPLQLFEGEAPQRAAVIEQLRHDLPHVRVFASTLELDHCESSLRIGCKQVDWPRTKVKLGTEGD